MSETIERIKENEVSELQQISETTFYDTFEGEYTEEDFKKFFEDNYNEPLLLKEMANPDSYHYFYKIDNQIAGYLKLNTGKAQTEPKGDEYLEIQRIYFYKTYQGGGRGKHLINLAIEKAQKLNKTKIWLGVWEHNHQALNFYKKHGFEVTGQHEFHTGNVIDIDLIMERSV